MKPKERLSRGQWLALATKQLTDAGIPTGRLDALVLLEDATGTDRAKLLAEPDVLLTDTEQAILDEQIAQRATHLPLAYLRGKTEFYGREFIITKNVLEPRPESETMIDVLKSLPIVQAKKYSPTHQPPTQATSHELGSTASAGPVDSTKDLKTVRIADVGTGSGALGITAYLELENAQVDLIELDDQALKTAKMNVDLFTINVSVIKSDLLAQTPQNYDVLLCNLPYVPDNFSLNPAAMREPKIAIFGGPDGLNLYRKLFNQLQNTAQKPLYILTEALPPQHEPLAEIAALGGYRLLKTDDFIQLFGI